MKMLDELITEKTEKKVPANVAISGVALDSRLVEAGDLFFACPGEHADGRDFIGDAIRRDAAAVVYEAPAVLRDDYDIPVIGMPKLASKVGDIASRYFDQPSERMFVIAVTGTNGKTSCTHFIAQALTALDRKCGIVGTLGAGFPGALDGGSLTTPDPVALQRSLADMCASGADVAALEASSHGLEQGRLNGTKIDVAVFTNITRDHLDYHETFADYKRAKRRLFEWQTLSAAVINIDDDFGAELARTLAERVQVVTFSRFDTAADVVCGDVEYRSSGMAGEVVTPAGRGRFSTSVLGDFNVGNILAVAGVLYAMGYGVDEITGAVSRLQTVRGRMDFLRHAGSPTVVIDFAHTPDALEKVIAATRKHCTGELWCVFGCGGDRDKGKRPLMGEVAERLADHVMVTDDNPRTEPSAGIIEDILAGMKAPARVRVESDRARAIREVLSSAAEDDIVVLAGKGHEEYQDVGGERIAYSDYTVVERFFERPKVIVGLGETGMSCVRYFKRRGVPFAVMDREPNPPRLDDLRALAPEAPFSAMDARALIEAGEIIVSPGVPLATPEIREAARAGVPVTGDVGIFAGVATAPIVAITGSNGKSTVTALVGRMATDQGVNTGIGGNIGTPCLDLLEDEPALYVIELSSYQLEAAPHFAWEIAVLLNLSPDHLDRYASVEDYYRTKARIYAAARKAVVNRDLGFDLDLSKIDTIATFGGAPGHTDNDLGLIESSDGVWLARGETRLMPVNEVRIRGRHNQLNALAALATGTLLGFEMAGMLETLRTFAGLEHRCEHVADIGGVSYFNDSKSTNIGSTEAAIEGLSAAGGKNVVLILGDMDKGADFRELIPAVGAHVKCLLVYGRDADNIVGALGETVPALVLEDLTAVVDAALENAAAGDVVLFSPACASFDMFDNFEHRGRVFKDLVWQREAGA